MERQVIAYSVQAYILGRSPRELSDNDLISELEAMAPGHSRSRLMPGFWTRTPEPTDTPPDRTQSVGRNDDAVQAPAQMDPEPVPVSPSSFLTGPHRATGPFKSERARQMSQVREILEANGHWPPVRGRAYVIQIDQDTPPAWATPTQRENFLGKGYSGQMMVFSHEENRAMELGLHGPFASASHPAKLTVPVFNRDRERISVSVDGDLMGEVAHIRTGVYEYRTRTNPKGRFNPTGAFKNSARDLDHDGVISGKEKDMEFRATAIQIHKGNKKGPSSSGCQTLPPDEFKKLSKAIKKANSANLKTFTYILVRRPNEEFKRANHY